MPTPDPDAAGPTEKMAQTDMQNGARKRVPEETHDEAVVEAWQIVGRHRRYTRGRVEWTAVAVRSAREATGCGEDVEHSAVIPRP